MFYAFFEISIGEYNITALEQAEVEHPILLGYGEETRWRGSSDRITCTLSIKSSPGVQ